MRARPKNYKNYKFKVLERLAVAAERLIIIGVYIVYYLLPACSETIINSALK